MPNISNLAFYVTAARAWNGGAPNALHLPRDVQVEIRSWNEAL